MFATRSKMFVIRSGFLLIAEALITTAFSQSRPKSAPIIPNFVLDKIEVVGEPLEESGFYGAPLCDPDGNLYLRTDEHLAVDENPVWKISPKGKKLQVYSAPKETEKEFRLGDFNVGADGSFYAVTYDYNEKTEKYILLRYGSDGEVSSKSRLQLPELFLLDKIGIFASGSILVSGHYSDKASESVRGHSRLLVLTSDGAPAGEVHLSIKATGSAGDFPPPGSVSMGEDGNAYLLRGEEVLVLSPSAQLQRSVAVSSPAEGFEPERIQVSHGVLSVTFYKVARGKTGNIEVMFRTFDTSTGVVQAEYVPKPGFNYQLCFSPDAGYTFLSREHDKTVLKRAWVR